MSPADSGWQMRHREESDLPVSPSLGTRAGEMPEASGDSSSGTFGKEMIASESPTFLHRIGDLLSLIFWGIVGAVVLLIILFQVAQWHLRGIDRREKAELKLVFGQAIADGTVYDPPVHRDTFVITSRHGNDPYTVWFTNSTSERVGFFVSKSFPYHGVWTFKDLTRRQPDFYRSRVTNE